MRPDMHCFVPNYGLLQAGTANVDAVASSEPAGGAAAEPAQQQPSDVLEVRREQNPFYEIAHLGALMGLQVGSLNSLSLCPWLGEMRGAFKAGE